MSKKVLVTGATGFVGSALQQRIVSDAKHNLTIAVRRPIAASNAVSVVEISDLSAETDWTAALHGIDVVVHAAARAHIMHEESTDPLAEYRRVNVDGTLHLARQAIAAGVQRFVFISSIKVNGETTETGQPFTADATPGFIDPYGVSKHEAEQGLLALAKESGLEVVIIRPVLVYGPGVKANFLSMLKWVSRGIPLPLGAIHNQRSIVSLDNLADLIINCIDHPAAVNQIFLASDGQDLSTTDMLKHIGTALNKPARLLPIPMSWLNTAFTLLGKKDFAQRLCSSLQVDISKNKELLGWVPPYSVEEGMKKTAKAFLRLQ